MTEGQGHEKALHRPDVGEEPQDPGSCRDAGSVELDTLSSFAGDAAHWEQVWSSNAFDGLTQNSTMVAHEERSPLQTNGKRNTASSTK